MGSTIKESKLHLLALPFSTEDVLDFQSVAKEHGTDVEIDIPRRLLKGQLLNELTRPMVKTHGGAGVLIRDHEKKSNSELLAAINVLRKLDRQLYSLSHGLIPLTPEALQKEIKDKNGKDS